MTLRVILVEGYAVRGRRRGVDHHRLLFGDEVLLKEEFLIAGFDLLDDVVQVY